MTQQSFSRPGLEHQVQRHPFGAAFLRTSHSWHVKYKVVSMLGAVLPEFLSSRLRARLYRAIGFDVDRSAFFLGNVKLSSLLPHFYAKLTIGPGAVIGNDVTLNLDAKITIGKNVSISPYTLIYTGSHQLGPGSNRRVSDVLANPVTIEDGCWIGLSAIILPGVTIGRGSVVAAGAVVSQDVPPNSLVEGNPARVVRSLPWGNR